MKKISIFFAALAFSAMAMAATYTKVISAPTDWSGEYILAYEAKTDTARVFTTAADAANNYVDAVIAKNAINGTFNTIVIAKWKDGYSLQVKGGTNNGKYMAGKVDANKIFFDDTATVATIEYKDNSVLITSKTSVMRFNSSKGSCWFRFFKAATYTNQKEVQLYKLKKETTDPVPVTAITADNAKDTVEVGDKLTLNYTITPDSATDQRVEFAITSGAEFATLDDGKLTGVAAGDVTVTVTALDSLNKDDKLFATYSIYVKAATLNTCADVNAAAKDDKLKLNAVTVSYVNGANVYVQDASGSTLIYMYDSGLKAGDVVSGIQGVAAPYNGLPELKPTNKVADWTITAGVAPTFPDATTAPAADQVNKIFTYKGVTELNGSFVEGTRSELTGQFLSEDFVLYSNFKQAATFDNAKLYDVVGAVGIINNTQVRVFFISATDVTPTRINEVAEKTAVKKMMHNGQMVIVRDGKMFNALGAEL